MQIRASSATARGRRSSNQDRALVAEALSLFAIADGVGGEIGGEVASELAVQALREFYASEGAGSACTPKDAILDAFELAQRSIARYASGRLARMASTLVALRIEGSAAALAHVGDSRAYRLRDGALTPLTVDHTIAEEWRVAVGGYCPARGDALTRALAAYCNSHAEATAITLRPGDVYLLCSDGVSKPLSDLELRDRLGSGEPEVAARALVEAAIATGGRDNATTVVIRVDGD